MLILNFYFCWQFFFDKTSRKKLEITSFYCANQKIRLVNHEKLFPFTNQNSVFLIRKRIRKCPKNILAYFTLQACPQMEKAFFLHVFLLVILVIIYPYWRQVWGMGRKSFTQHVLVWLLLNSRSSTLSISDFYHLF